MPDRVSQPTRRLVLKGRYVFPVVGAPIPDGAVTIAEGRIVAVGPYRAGEASAPHELHDLGNAAILPGLVNAHVHLEFSNLASPLGHRGIGFVDWLRRVMDHRRQVGAEEPPVMLGLAESIRSGVTTLGEIAQPGWATDNLSSPFGRGVGGEGGGKWSVVSGQWPVARTAQGTTTCHPLIPNPQSLISDPSALTLTLSQRERGPVQRAVRAAPEPVSLSLLNLTIFQELIAPTVSRVATAVDLAKSFLQSHAAESAFWQPGLSPHAPYSVHPDLLSAVAAISAEQKVPVAMHLAESPEELELLRTGGGPLRTFLEEREAWDAAAIPPATRPMDYLRRLAMAHRALIVHGNYLDDEEIAFLGANARRMSVVYCPRSHDWFGHRPYPLREMLASGVVVSLGTDGRGSVPDLKLLTEMRVVARQHPNVPFDRILQMGTIDGARALGWDQHVGSLEPGKQADLAVVAMPNRDAADPHRLLFESDELVVSGYFRGVETCLSPDFPNRRANSSSTSTNETPQ